MAEELLSKFHISGATYYDGVGHHLTESECTLTNMRLTIEDSRGKTQQILLRDITGVTPHMGFGSKSVDINVGNAYAIHLYCKGRERVREVAGILNEAMRPSFS
jgi:hypothetical protein